MQLQRLKSLYIVPKIPGSKRRDGERGLTKLLASLRSGAVVTLVGVNTQCFAACPASVFHSLTIEELLHSMTPYEIQIVDHAHVVSCSILIVKSLETSAGEFIAVRAEPDFILHQKPAALLQKCTALVPRPTAGTSDLALLPTQSVAEIRNAQSAIHSAGSNQVRSHREHT